MHEAKIKLKLVTGAWIFTYNNYNNTHIAAATKQPQLQVKLLTFKPKCTLSEKDLHLTINPGSMAQFHPIVTDVKL